VPPQYRPLTRRLARKLRRLFSGDGLLVVKAAILLAVTRAALPVCSFQIILKLVSRASEKLSKSGSVPSTQVRRVHWAIGRASRWIPGVRHCLTQALTAKILLARAGFDTQLRIGVTKDPAGMLTAHAWLESEGAAVFGVPESGLDQFRLLPPLHSMGGT
jgi:hypothetical protein